MSGRDLTFLDSADTPNRRRAMPHPISLMWIVYLALTAVSILWSRYKMSQPAHAPFPYQDYVLPLIVRGADLECFQARFHFFGTSAFFSAPGQAFNYSPLMAVLLHVYFSLTDHPVRLFTCIALLWLLLLGSCFTFALPKQVSRLTASLLVISMLCLAYPILVLVYLDNLELFVWIPLLMGIWAYLTERYWIAAFCFAIPASLKYFPIIFFGLLLSRKTFKQLIAGGSLTVLLLAASTWYLGPTFSAALRGLQAQMVPFTKYYLLSWHPMEGGLDHSTYGLLKVALLKTPLFLKLPMILQFYVPTMAIILALLFVFCIRKAPPINQVMALTIISITFTPLSHDYTLVHLYAPLGAMIFWLFSRPVEVRVNRSVTAIFICFGILLAPITFIEHGIAPLSGQLRCLLLLVVLILSLSRHARFEQARSALGAS